MPSLSKRIMERACASGGRADLRGSAAASRQPRGSRSGALATCPLREAHAVCQGVYLRPVETRFGPCAPSIDISALADVWGETIVPCGGASAHVLGLTTQIPVRSVYLTSGPDRRLRFGNLEVELRHAPRWQLAAPRGRAGEVIRALAWLGPEEVREGLRTVLPTLSREDIDQLADARATMPHWMAEAVSLLAAYG